MLSLLATVAALAGFLFFGWILIVRPKQISKLHDQVVADTTQDVLLACLSYGQSQLTGSQYEKFKDLLTDQINNGAGGITLAKLVEDCIEKAQEESV